MQQTVIQRIVLSLSFLFIFSGLKNLHAQAAEDWFITVWDLSKLPVASGQDKINFAAYGDDYRIEWHQQDNPAVNGSLISSTVVDISFPNPGKTYIVKAHSGAGELRMFQTGFVNNTAEALIDVKQWGNTAWRSLAYAFFDCKNLNISATDTPDLSLATTLAGMFEEATSFNSAVDFKTDNVTDMRRMFRGATAFNQPVNFNSGKVTDMREMFRGATAFNQPLLLNTQSVTAMESMFYNAKSFNQPINFNTQNVTTMSNMFWGAESFNQPLRFDSPNLVDVSNMFSGATSFNSQLDLKTENVVTMLRMFSGAASFNQSLNFDTRKVTTMSYMFLRASSFNQPVSFNTENVTNMGSMFSYASAFNQAVNFNTTKVKNMDAMFLNAVSFNQPLAFNTDEVTSMQNMFSGASSFNQPLAFNTDKVLYMGGMFEEATSFNQPINFNTGKVTTMGSMFRNAVSFNQDLGHLNLSSLSNGLFMFEKSGMSCENYTKTLTGWAASSGTNAGVNFSFQNNMLFASSDPLNGRYRLINDLGWTITGDEVFNGTCAQALPATFGPVSAQYINGGLRVNWQTLSERNVSHYVVQASLDGVGWMDIGSVSTLAENGNSDISLTYEFTSSGLPLAALAVLGLFFLPLCRRRSQVLLTLLIVAAGLAACSKTYDKLPEENTLTVFVRIAQYDTDGSVRYSTIVKSVQ